MATTHPNKHRRSKKIKNVLIDLVIIIALGVFTVALFCSYSPKNLLLFAIILIFFSFTFVSVSIIILLSELKTMSSINIVMSSAFAALIFSINYFSMLLPPFLYAIIPFAAGFFFYFPSSIVYGAFRYIAHEKGAAFFIMLLYGLLSELFWPNLLWLPYYLAWGSILEIVSDEEYPLLEGFIFGFVGASLSVNYMLITWGYYKPIFIILPSIIGDGVLSLFGFRIGLKIGKEMSSVFGR